MDAVGTNTMSLLQSLRLLNRLFSHGVISAILVSHNNEMVAILVLLTNHLGVQPFQQMLNFSFVPINFIAAGHVSGKAL